MKLQKKTVTIFFVIVLLCLAQIFWWMYFQVQQNRTVINLHKKMINSKAQEMRRFLTLEYRDLIQGSLNHPLHILRHAQENDWPPSHFVVTADTIFLRYQDLIYFFPINWPFLEQKLAVTDSSFILQKKAPISSTPVTYLELPLTVLPKYKAEDDLQDQMDRRTVMFLSEGSFFALMVMIGIYFLYAAFRRELQLQEHQKNFILSMTHELRSPLSSIKLYLQTLQRRQIADERREQFVQHSLADVERLQRLVENVLDAARIERNDYDYQMDTLDISQLVKTVLDKWRTSDTDSAIAFTERISSGVHIHADAHAMISVVNNLIENAVKYSQTPKQVNVDLIVMNERVVLSVTDNGQGVAPEDRKKVFERFYRAGNEMTRTTKGTGLGLYIVKRIVEAHHGTIDCHAAPNGGAVFTVSVPTTKK